VIVFQCVLKQDNWKSNNRQSQRKELHLHALRILRPLGQSFGSCSMSRRVLPQRLVEVIITLRVTGAARNIQAIFGYDLHSFWSSGAWNSSDAYYRGNYGKHSYTSGASQRITRSSRRHAGTRGDQSPARLSDRRVKSVGA
jgi:hypothetical protein